MNRTGQFLVTLLRKLRLSTGSKSFPGPSGQSEPIWGGTDPPIRALQKPVRFLRVLARVCFTGDPIVANRRFETARSGPSTARSQQVPCFSPKPNGVFLRSQRCVFRRVLLFL